MNSNPASESECRCRRSCDCCVGCRGSGAGNELGKWFRKLRRHWFAKRKKRLPLWGQFLIALLGVMTYLVSLVLITFRGTSLALYIGTPNLVTTFAIMVCTIAFFFAWMVVDRRSRAGPVRLYLAGLTLPALVIVVIRYSIGLAGFAVSNSGGLE